MKIFVIATGYVGLVTGHVIFDGCNQYKAKLGFSYLSTGLGTING